MYRYVTACIGMYQYVWVCIGMCGYVFVCIGMCGTHWYVLVFVLVCILEVGT